MNPDLLSKTIVDETNNYIYLTDPDTYELIYLNRAARELYGLSEDVDLKGAKCYEILQGKDAPCEFCTNHLLSQDDFYVWEHYNPVLDRHFMLKNKLAKVDGRLLRLEIATDITEKNKMTQDLHNRLSVEESLVRCISTLKSGTDVDTAINDLLKHVGEFYYADRAYIFEIDYVNKEVNNTYEWCDERSHPEIDNLQHVPIDAIGRWIEAFDKFGFIQISSVGKSLDKDSLEYQILEPQGIERLIAAPLVDEKGSYIGFIGVDDPEENFESAHLLSSISYFIVDDLEKRKMIAQLERMSYEDALTGTKNRNCYFKRLHELQHDDDASLGVVYLDINGLKRTNDTYGHSYGDEIIKLAASHLQTAFETDIYRIGGDEFVVLCVDMDHDVFHEKVELVKELAKTSGSCSFSIGAKWDKGEFNAADLVADADELMYINKQSYYQSSLASMPRHRAIFVKELCRAINDGAYEVFLQPKVELKTQKIYGAEALVRRRENDGSLTSPAKFISLLESEGAIRYIDFFVLETVCQTLQKWKEEGTPLLQMAVNFSRITLMEDTIVENMLKICHKYDIDPSWITIEVTESIGRLDMDVLRVLIIEIVKAGFSISLDDFGSQYSNLAILSSIDFDELKFDRSLVKNIEGNEKSSVIINHAISMGRMLNKTASVAEGIETKKQLEILEDMDCDYGQGYYFSKPVSIEDFHDMINEK